MVLGGGGGRVKTVPTMCRHFGGLWWGVWAILLNSGDLVPDSLVYSQCVVPEIYIFFINVYFRKSENTNKQN